MRFYDSFLILGVILLPGCCQNSVSFFCVVVAMSSSGERELYNIRKFDGTNFSLWKEQIQDVLVQKKQLKPISGPTARPADKSETDWAELDALAKSTMRLHLAESV